MTEGIYFDNAATSFPKPPTVYGFADSFYRSCGVNANRGSYPLAIKADNLIDDTRRGCLKLFHSENKTIVFCDSATMALNTVIHGLNYSKIKTVYISPFEHNAVLRPIYDLQNLFKFDIMKLTVSVSPLQYDIDEIKRQFAVSPPDLVLLSHASNVCGLIAPFNDIFTAAKQYGAVTLLDMSQTAGLVDTDLSTADVDYAVFAGHKTMCAPFGIAGLILKRNATIKPFLYGGTGTDSASMEMPLSLPERLEAGSHNTYAIAGLSAALKWIQDTGIEAIHKQETTLIETLKILLCSYENIRIIGENDGVPIVSCVFEEYSSDEIGYILSRNNIAIRTGLHCAPLAHRFLSTFPQGTVRFSLGYFNSDSELEQLKSVLDEIAKG